MAAENGRARADLSERLLQEPFRFDFFQAVRLLERVVRERSGEDPRWQCSPVGEDSAPERELARFRALPSLSFPASPVAEMHVPPLDPESGELPPVAMVVTFLGLIGPSGVLPQHYTALLLRRLRDKDHSLRDFLDLFNHRLVSLFYRAWEKYRLPFAYERSKLARPDETDLATWGVYCLVGLGTEGLRGRLEVDDEAFLYYAGHFSHQPRCAIALECLLADYFGVPIEVEQLEGQWLPLGAANRSLLAGLGGRNNGLGVNLVVGKRIWDVQSKFRLRVGPLTWQQFRRLMPDGDRLRPLCQLTRTYAGPELDFDVQLVLQAAEVPKCRLSQQGDRSRLGWNTWVHSRPAPADVDDAVFVLEVM